MNITLIPKAELVSCDELFAAWEAARGIAYAHQLALIENIFELNKGAKVEDDVLEKIIGNALVAFGVTSDAQAKEFFDDSIKWRDGLGPDGQRVGGLQ